MAPYICIRKCHWKLLLPQRVHTLGTEGIVLGLKLCICSLSRALQHLLSQRVGSWMDAQQIFITHQYHYPNVVAVQRVDMFAPENRTLLPSTKLCNMHKTEGKSLPSWVRPTTPCAVRSCSRSYVQHDAWWPTSSTPYSANALQRLMHAYPCTRPPTHCTRRI